MAVKTVNARYRHPCRTAAQWTSANPVLLSGEVGYESDTGKSKVGDGIKKWSELGYTGIDKVDKVSGKGLSTNDYSTDEKTKLAGIAAGANNYTHPVTHPWSIIIGAPTSYPANGGTATYAGMLSLFDTRDDNPTPAQVYVGQKKAIKWEFKYANKIGLTTDMTGHTYVILLTIVPWTDKSGGLPVQISYCQNGKIFRRVSNADGSAWLAWEALSVDGHTHKTAYTATLTAAGWSTSAPYTQTVSISGITAYDTPIVEAVLSSTTATAISQQDAWGCVSKITTAANSITVTCLEEKPTINIPIRLMAIR